MTPVRRAVRRPRLGAAGARAGRGRPTSISLDEVESAGVDFGDDVVWVLALGSDADGTTADAIELVGLDLESGARRVSGSRATPGNWRFRASDRINVAIRRRSDLTARGGPSCWVSQPDYVFATGFDGYGTW